MDHEGRPSAEGLVLLELGAELVSWWLYVAAELAAVERLFGLWEAGMEEERLRRLGRRQGWALEPDGPSARRP